MAAVPIWKDYLVTIPGFSTEFRIRNEDTSTVIYNGVSVAKPGEASAYVRINDICADYILNALPTMTDRTFTAMSVPTFKVQRKSGGSWTDIATVQFYNDWSYDYNFSGNFLSAPINGRVDGRMFILNTKLNISGSVQATYRRPNGYTASRYTTVSPTPNNGTVAFKANAVSGAERITINSEYYYSVGECFKFALYYVNAYGGWDQFLLEGNDLEVDNLERFLLEKDYDNNQLVNAGRVNYVNEVTKTWTLHSGLLTDAQASRMHHLINSCLVYLCDIATGNFIPVIITTNTCEYKTFKNQGRRMADYTFTIQLAQNRIRR